MSNIPPELLFDIILQLHPTDLNRCMCVSKAWYAFIHDQRFIKAHLQHSVKTNSTRTILLNQYEWKSSRTHLFSLAFGDDDSFGKLVDIGKGGNHQLFATNLSYSNGLVCTHNNGTNSEATVWNLSIQKLKKIPSSPKFEQHPSSDLETRNAIASSSPFYKFGYDSVNDDYKLVRIVFFSGVSPYFQLDCQVQIYSLSSNSWKRIQDIPSNGFNFHLNNLVFSNRALSWPIVQFSNNIHIYKILTLDLACEKHQVFDTPLDENNTSFLVSLIVLEDHLCFSVDHSYGQYDICIMKEDGVTKSWTLLYSIELTALLGLGVKSKPLVFSKNGKMVLLQVCNGDSTRLFWYDLETRSAKKVKIRGQPHRFQATICWGSLCLLDGDPAILKGQHVAIPLSSASKEEKNFKP